MDSTRFKNESVFMCKLFFLNSFEPNIYMNIEHRSKISVRGLWRKNTNLSIVYIYMHRECMSTEKHIWRFMDAG